MRHSGVLLDYKRDASEAFLMRPLVIYCMIFKHYINTVFSATALSNSFPSLYIIYFWTGYDGDSKFMRRELWPDVRRLDWDLILVEGSGVLSAVALKTVLILPFLEMEFLS